MTRWTRAERQALPRPALAGTFPAMSSCPADLIPTLRSVMDDRARFEEFARLATEQRNPRTMDLDMLEVPELLARINAEDQTVSLAVARELPYVARAVELIVASFEAGGRLVYVGAGTS